MSLGKEYSKRIAAPDFGPVRRRCDSRKCRTWYDNLVLLPISNGRFPGCCLCELNKMASVFFVEMFIDTELCEIYNVIVDFVILSGEFLEVIPDGLCGFRKC